MACKYTPSSLNQYLIRTCYSCSKCDLILHDSLNFKYISCIGRYDNFQSAIMSKTTKTVRGRYSSNRDKYTIVSSYLFLTD